MRPFRFALQTSVAPDVAAWRERARLAEALGYSCLFIPDHLDNQFGPLVALTVAAEATTTLRVGSLVLDNDYRHPVVVAKEIATLDLISEGRVEFGIGAGWMRTDYDAAGIPYDPPGVRIDRLEEALAILKALWGEGRATFAGRHYTVTDAECLPLPLTRPHPPILIGGGGKRVLSMAARQADIVGINPDLRAGRINADVVASAAPERWDERIEWVRAAAGDRFDQLDLQILTFVVMIVDDRAAAAEQVAPLFGVDPATALDMPIALVGTIEQICDTLVERRERWGFNYVVVHEAELETFAPVVERLTGT
ncbi:MAG TPA: TIGR03621 family F420-dependent LLM class oxidoreductase [Acidimicrobiales bacterium]|nr:TIGR03621 family F420-dependent LLM class oxidoreductase [Acidimicrobiales bacterium]